MGYMFYGCSKLNSIDLSNFDTSKVEEMKEMFSYCSSLFSLNLSNFNTSKVITMNSMIQGYSKLIFLDISNFNTSRVKAMKSMFHGCSSLNTLNLSNFDTSKVITMEYMFSSCSSLVSLDLSNFNKSSVTIMHKMFNGCSKLISLDLANFDTSCVTNIDCIFYDCPKFEYVNLKKAKIDSNYTFPNYCYGFPSDLTICSENEEWSTIFNLSEKKNVNCINNISFYNNNEAKSNIIFFKKRILDNPCQICGKNYFKINETENIHNISYINCYEYIEGYYFDVFEFNYKPCYSSCKKCNKGGNKTNHNCIECKEKYKLEINLLIYKNCFFDDTIDFYSSINTLTQNFMYNDNSIETFTDTSFTSSKLNAIDYSIDSEITENKFITNKITYLNNPTSSYSSYYNKYKILTDIILENEIEMKNRTELIQNKINNLFTKLIISDIDSGKSEKIYEKKFINYNNINKASEK